MEDFDPARKMCNTVCVQFDRSDPEKHVLAKRCLDELWENQRPVALSIQVLHATEDLNAGQDYGGVVVVNLLV